jgi:hypothetical protein
MMTTSVSMPPSISLLWKILNIHIIHILVVCFFCFYSTVWAFTGLDAGGGGSPPVKGGVQGIPPRNALTASSRDITLQLEQGILSPYRPFQQVFVCGIVLRKYGQLVTNKRLRDVELQALTSSTALCGCPEIPSLCT